MRRRSARGELTPEAQTIQQVFAAAVLASGARPCHGARALRQCAPQRRGRAAISGTDTSDPAEAIRSAIVQIEQRVDALAKALLGTEEVARTATAANQVQLMMRKGVGDHMARQLAFFNMPSREDIEAVGERLMSMEERLTAIEMILAEMAPAPKKKAGPPRTKKPRSKKPETKKTKS